FKALNLQTANNPATVEAAIGMELEKDPTINMYKTQLFELNQQLQQKLANSKNPNSADIKRVRMVIQQAEAQLTHYQGQASRSLRERIARMPNDALRATIAEYNIRRKSAEENLAKYQQELDAARLKLEGLGVRNPEQEMLEGNIESEKEIAGNLELKVLE